jgi:hypothetical protein
MLKDKYQMEMNQKMKDQLDRAQTKSIKEKGTIPQLNNKTISLIISIKSEAMMKMIQKGMNIEPH